MEMLEELKNDFKDAVKSLNPQAYDPYSKPFMKALFIGQLALAVKKFCKNDDEDNDIEEELEGAEKYYWLYKKTNDIQYKEMAKDELKHADILIHKHSLSASPEEKIDLKKHELKHNEIMKMIDPSYVKV